MLFKLASAVPQHYVQLFSPMPSDQLRNNAVAVRANGLRVFLKWGFAFLGTIAMCIWIFPTVGLQLNPFELPFIALPGGIALSGLVEAVSGIPFMHLSQHWDTLRPWQRGVVGTLIAVAAICIVLIVVPLLLYEVDAISQK